MKKISYQQLLQNHVLKPYAVILDKYVENHFKEKIFIPILEKFSRMLPEEARLLDVGCGPGGETKFLLEQGFEVMSIDVSDAMLQQARLLVPDGNFTNMNLLEMTFEDDLFDGLWSARTLLHIPSDLIPKALAEYKRVLKPGALLCLTELTGETEEIESEYYDDTNSTTTFFHHFSEGELEAALAEAGFEIIDTMRSYLGEEKEEHLSIFAKNL